MKRMKIGAWGLAAGLLLMLPQIGSAQAWTGWGGQGGACSGATLVACVQFDLFENEDGSYTFTTTYLESANASDPGVLTAAGFYDVDTGETPNFTFWDVTMTYNPGGWSAYPRDTRNDGMNNCQHLNGDGNVVLGTCGDADGGSTYGFAPGGSVSFSFQTDPAQYGDGLTLVDALNSGAYGARAHVQSFGTVDCSFKPDSRGGVTSIVSPPEGGLENCGANVVPEPATIFLLATGLIGVGAVGYRSRRREEQEEA